LRACGKTPGKSPGFVMPTRNLDRGHLRNHGNSAVNLARLKLRHGRTDAVAPATAALPLVAAQPPLEAAAVAASDRRTALPTFVAAAAPIAGARPRGKVSALSVRRARNVQANALRQPLAVPRQLALRLLGAPARGAGALGTPARSHVLQASRRVDPSLAVRRGNSGKPSHHVGQKAPRQCARPVPSRPPHSASGGGVSSRH
jgi:hypothetical protein